LKKEQVDAVEIAEKQRHLYLLGKVRNNQPLTKGELDELAGYEKKTSVKNKAGRKSKDRIADDRIIKTQKDAAEYAGVDPRTVRRWVKNKMPRTEEGWYIKSMLDYFKEHDGQRVTESKERHKEAEADLKSYKAQLAELELAEKQGQFLLAADVREENVRKVVTLKRALLGLGRKVAPRAANIKNPKKIQRLIDEEIRTLIQEFAAV